MTGGVFIDTNVLVYADDRSARVKRDRARALLRSLIRSSRAVLSTQVLQEFFVITTRKLGVAPEVARRKVERLSRLEVVLVRPEIVLGAIDLYRLHSLSFWDALVIRCASAAGCTTVATEDMNDGEVIDGVRVENPFR